jgi:hypothetical protein
MPFLTYLFNVALEEANNEKTPVAAGKILSSRREAGRPLADEHVPLADGALHSSFSGG